MKKYLIEFSWGFENPVHEELEVKMSEVKEEKDQEVQQEREAQQPVSQLERILNA